MPRPAGSALMEKIVALCKRRGFIFQASEIYGGINGFWDYGPLGCLLKNNLRDAWWRDMVLCPPIGPDGEPLQIVGLDTAIIQHPKTWVASGHVATFADPLRRCRKCGEGVRADHLWDVLFSQSVWVDSLLQEFTPVSGQIDAPRLIHWAKGKGKRLAPNLALVRNPEVTLSWVGEYVRDLAGNPFDVRLLFQYFATEQLAAGGLQTPCPKCGGEMEEARPFKLMFESYAGLTQTEENKVYLRPETAQGIFLEYKNILDTTRVKVPFGVAQVGKSFRNEVTPRNSVYRSREFEQMEMEWFCSPDESQKWYEYWRDERLRWWTSVGVKRENLQLREHDKEELSHYSSATADIEYKYPFTEPGFGELEGVAHRGCYDLTQHQQHSGAKLEYFDQERQEKKIEPCRYLPHVIEPASGLTRGLLVLLCEAYDVDETRPSPELMRFAPAMAPVKCGIFPLVNKDGMPEIALKLYHELRKKYVCQYDGKQSIGKRYARMDEAGTPFCLTVDGQTKDDQTVTVRDRDTGGQVRVNLDKVGAFLSEKL